MKSRIEYQILNYLGFRPFNSETPLWQTPEELLDRGLAFTDTAGLTLHLLAKLQDPKISIDELEKAVGQDLAVSYRILRYLNSPINAMPRKIESLRHAIGLVAWWNAPELRVARRRWNAKVCGAIGYWNVGRRRRYFATGAVRLDTKRGFWVDT